MPTLAKYFLTWILVLVCTKLFSQKDTLHYSEKIITVKGEKYIGFLNRYGFALLNSKNDTIIKQEGGYHDWEYKDFDNDGWSDIFLEILGNTPACFDLFLYNSSQNRFEQIINFESFPDPIRIGDSKYYYSYHKAGCADNNWVSDLFFIKENKPVHIGKIYGKGCEADVKNDPQIIEIYKIVDNNDRSQSLIEKLSYQKYIPKFEDKWEFIKKYWEKNYSKFIKSKNKR